VAAIAHSDAQWRRTEMQNVDIKSTDQAKKCTALKTESCQTTPQLSAECVCLKIKGACRQILISDYHT